MAFFFRLVIACSLFGCGRLMARPPINGNGISITRFGALPNSNEDATPAVRQALAFIRKHPVKRLSFPAGRYDFYPAYASEKYVFSSNNDEGLKRIVFLLQNLKDLLIDGQGASFIFHGFVSPFLLEHCNGVTLKNFSVDWLRTFHSEATIVGSGPEGIDFSISPQYPYRITHGQLAFTDRDGTEYPYGSLLEFDTSLHETAFMAHDYYFGNRLPARETAPGKVRVLLPEIMGKPGNVMVFNAAGRTCSAITVSDSRNISVVNLAIYHCGGMGILAQRSSDILVDRLQVTRSPGTDRVLSITADATHFVNCGGRIQILHSLLENQMDDATNIHGMYVQAARKEGPAVLVVELKHEQQQGFDFIVPGSRLELVHNTTLEAYDTLQVKAVSRINKTFTRVTFTQPLPSQLVIGKDVLAATGSYPNVTISDCIIRKNRARGLLIGSRGKVLIEHNFFHTAGAALLFEGDGTYWFEQAGVRDVTIRDNVFSDCLYGVWGNAVIQVGSGIQPGFQNASRYNRNIRIENNVFKGFDPRILHLYAVQGLVFEHNVVTATRTYPGQNIAARAFVVSDCSGVVIRE